MEDQCCKEQVLKFIPDANILYYLDKSNVYIFEYWCHAHYNLLQKLNYNIRKLLYKQTIILWCSINDKNMWKAILVTYSLNIASFAMSSNDTDYNTAN